MATEEITISELELADEILGDMNIPVDTATETRAVTLKQLRAWLGSALPVGSIFASVGRLDDERFTLLDGKTISRIGTYEAFCNKVVEKVQAGNWFACSEEEYAQDLSDFGQCGKFVVSNDYVRIPTITRFIGATITLSEIGKTYKESLPNITGTTACNTYKQNNTTTGAFYVTDRASGGYSSPATVGCADFDASRSSSTYQDGAKVQPDHTKYPYYMVVSTEGQTANVEIDINQVYEDLNLKATTDLSNVASVASSFKEQSVGWGMPDYDRAISITANTAFVAPFNGFIEVAGEYGNNGGFTVCLGNTIDKTKQILRGAQSGTSAIHSGGQAVIVKGQTYYFEAAMTINRAIICPLKGVS